MSAIIGSAIYNILVIPTFAVYPPKKSFKANRDLVYREAPFSLVSVAALMYEGGGGWSPPPPSS